LSYGGSPCAPKTPAGMFPRGAWSVRHIH